MSNPDVRFGTKLALDKLSDEELATFGNLIGWEDADLKKAVEKQPWFPKVETLFTEDGGQNIHQETRAAIDRIMTERLAGK